MIPSSFKQCYLKGRTGYSNVLYYSIWLLSVELEFRISIQFSRIQDSSCWISDSKATSKNFSGSGFHITLRYGTTGRENVRFVLLQNGLNRAFSLTWPASMQISKNLLHKKRVQLRQDWFGTPHGRCFLVLEIQYGRRDVMWKHSIAMLLVLQPTNQICLATNQMGVGCGK